MHGYTRALRDDLHGKPVRITNVAPGLVETNFSNVRYKGDEEKAAAVYANVALGGPLHAEDVADCIMFALTRPPHVNIDEIVVLALAQVSGANVVARALAALVPVTAQAVPGLPERRDLVVDRLRRAPRSACAAATNSSWSIPSRTREAQRSSSSSSRSRCAPTSSCTPKWINASRSGRRRANLLHRRVPGLDIDVGRR